MDEWVGVVGATSFVGECLFPLVLEKRWRVLALSRRPLDRTEPGVIWCNSDTVACAAENNRVEKWVFVTPIWVIPEYFDLMLSMGVKRVVALSSTSRFTKEKSSDLSEQVNAQKLVEGESRLQEWAEANRIDWIVLRPTMVYGLGRDRNLTEIARFIRRFGLFPLLGQANGLRQPIHVQDLARACINALESHGIGNRAYNLSGGEVLPYHEMISRVFAALDRPPRMLSVPLVIFRMAVAMLRIMPRYRNWTAAMAERMNRDLIFDHSEAAKDLAFKPRAFELSREDVTI